MFRHSIFLSMLLLGSLCPAPAVAAGAVKVSGITYHMTDALERLTPADKQRLEQYKSVDHCLTWAPKPYQEAALQRALTHIETTLKDPQFQAFINEKREWTTPKGAADPAKIIAQLSQPRHISILLYE